MPAATAKDPADQLVTRQQFAALRGVDLSTVKRWYAKKKIVEIDSPDDARGTKLARLSDLIEAGLYELPAMAHEATVDLIADTLAQRDNDRLRKELLAAQARLAVVDDVLQDKVQEIAWLRRQVEALTGSRGGAR